MVTEFFTLLMLFLFSETVIEMIGWLTGFNVQSRTLQCTTAVGLEVNFNKVMPSLFRFFKESLASLLL